MNWIKDKLGQTKVFRALANAHEEGLYAQAATEVADGAIRPGLWAKAFADAEGDERRAKARYIGLRVEQLQLQLSAAGEIGRIADQSPAKISPSSITPTHAFKPTVQEPRIQCVKCRGHNVRPTARVFQMGGEGHAPYCLDCKMYLYGRMWLPVD